MRTRSIDVFGRSAVADVVTTSAAPTPNATAAGTSFPNTRINSHLRSSFDDHRKYAQKNFGGSATIGLIRLNFRTGPDRTAVSGSRSNMLTWPPWPTLESI
jgi:hypothetical protein